jgi:valyl-tRNA synthetase
MTNSKSIVFLNSQEQAPVGCAFSVLSDKCKLYILLKGIIDIDKEEAKLGKKKELLNQQIESLRKEQAKENYETRVPEAVRQKNQEKVSHWIRLLRLFPIFNRYIKIYNNFKIF